MSNENFLSLFDYLGHPAGSDLGKAVATAAYKGGVEVRQREVSTRNYSGKILVYPESFLISYFSEEKKLDETVDDFDLPF